MHTVEPKVPELSVNLKRPQHRWILHCFLTFSFIKQWNRNMKNPATKQQQWTPHVCSMETRNCFWVEHNSCRVQNFSLPCKELQIENRYIVTTRPGPNEKKPIDQVRPNRTVRPMTALRSCKELRFFADSLLALIFLIWIRTTMNTVKLPNKIRRTNATTVA